MYTVIEHEQINKGHVCEGSTVSQKMAWRSRKDKRLITLTPDHLFRFGPVMAVFLQDQNFLGSLMTPCLKIWGSFTHLEGQNFFILKFPIS